MKGVMSRLNIKRVLSVSQDLLRNLLLKIGRGKCLTIHLLSHIGKSNVIRVRNGGQMVLGRIYTGMGAVLSCPGGIMNIDDGVYFNGHVYVVARGEIKIGRGCLIGPNVCIVDHDHRFGSEGVGSDYRVGSVHIGAHCWIGANVVILRNTKIGDGCVIGAGTVIKGEIPAHSKVIPSRDFKISSIPKE